MHTRSAEDTPAQILVSSVCCLGVSNGPLKCKCAEEYEPQMLLGTAWKAFGYWAEAACWSQGALQHGGHFGVLSYLLTNLQGPRSNTICMRPTDMRWTRPVVARPTWCHPTLHGAGPAPVSLCRA